MRHAKPHALQAAQYAGASLPAPALCRATLSVSRGASPHCWLQHRNEPTHVYTVTLNTLLRSNQVTPYVERRPGMLAKHGQELSVEDVQDGSTLSAALLAGQRYMGS